MREIITLIPSAVILSAVFLYAVFKILKSKLKSNELLKISIVIAIISCYLIFSYSCFSNYFIRYLFFILITTLALSFIFKYDLQKVFISTFITWVLVAISELLFALGLSIFTKGELSTFFGVLLSNVCISLILIILINNKYILSIVQKSLEKISSSMKRYVITLVMILSLSISIIVYINYFNVDSGTRLILSLGIIIIYTVITIILFNEKDHNNKIQYEYENVLANLNEYEKMLDFQKVTNHENKNELLAIRGMIEKQDPKLKEYLDSIISEKRDDNEDFLYKTNIIPSGGLRGLVYYKTLSMKDKKINVLLKIPNKIRKIKLEKMGISINRDLCKIMGIILDNSTQAVEGLKQKNIDIEMSCNEKEFVIMVSNNFEGNLDLSKLDDMGYTTKGAGHGYGLTLLKQLVAKNKKITNQKYIYGRKFVQKIVVDLR